MRRTFGKDDHGNVGEARSGEAPADVACDCAQVRQRKLKEDVRRQLAGPRVEDLEQLRARAHLTDQVADRDVGEDLQEPVALLRVGVQPLFRCTTGKSAMWKVGGWEDGRRGGREVG